MTTTANELHYRDALATVRAIVANDQLAVETLTKHADPEGAMLTDIASVALYLFTAHVDDPLQVIDAHFGRVPETLVRAAEERRRRNGSGQGDAVASCE